MLFKTRGVVHSNAKIEESIKNDLIQTLKNKGINILNVNINLKSGNVNVSVCMSKPQN